MENWKRNVHGASKAYVKIILAASTSHKPEEHAKLLSNSGPFKHYDP